MTELKRGNHQTYRDPDTHLFAIGQAMKLKGGFGQPVLLPGIFRITGLLPASDGQPQYRIRNDEERHERVAMQANIEPVRTAGTGDAARLQASGRPAPTEMARRNGRKQPAGRA
jgi:hypothetical protein